MTTIVAITAGGLGALARYGLAGAVQRFTRSPRPWGTAAVNISGAALLGALLAVHAEGGLSDRMLTVAGTGFAGGFTTFSTWMVESVRLAEPGTPRQLLAAGLNIAGMITGGIVAVVGFGWLTSLI